MISGYSAPETDPLLLVSELHSVGVVERHEHPGGSSSVVVLGAPGWSLVLVVAGDLGHLKRRSKQSHKTSKFNRSQHLQQSSIGLAECMMCLFKLAPKRKMPCSRMRRKLRNE